MSNAKIYKRNFHDFDTSCTNDCNIHINGHGHRLIAIGEILQICLIINLKEGNFSASSALKLLRFCSESYRIILISRIGHDEQEFISAPY